MFSCFTLKHGNVRTEGVYRDHWGELGLLGVFKLFLFGADTHQMLRRVRHILDQCLDSLKQRCNTGTNEDSVHVHLATATERVSCDGEHSANKQLCGVLPKRTYKRCNWSKEIFHRSRSTRF